MVIHKNGLSSLAVFVLLLSVTCIPSGKAQDPVSTGITVAFGKMAVGSVLNQAEQTLQNLNSMLTSDLNMDFGNGVITYQAAVGGLINSLDKERTATVNSLDTERQSALWDTYNMGNQLLNKQVVPLQAKLEVNMLTVLNHVALMKNTPFMITNIDPTVLTYQASGDYLITVTGIGIGNYQGTQIPTSVTLTFPDEPTMKIQPQNIVDGIQFTIPGAAVAAKFQTNWFYQIRVTIASQVPDPCGVMHLIHCVIPANTTYSFPYLMRLFPKYAVAGNLSQATVTPTTDPSTRKTAAAAVVDIPAGSNSNWQTWATNVVLADPGYQIVSIDPNSRVDNDYGTGGACNFALADAGVFNPKSDPQSMGGMAQVTGKTNGPRCREEWTVWEEKQTTTGVSYPSTWITFKPGDSQIVMVHSDDVTATMNLTSATGRSQLDVIVPIGAASPITDFVVCSAPFDAGGGMTGYDCKAQGIDFY